MPSLTVLGVETSCDETAAAVVRWTDGGQGPADVLSSVVASQVAAHRPYGGVVPEVAARAHVEIIDTIIAQAMDEAGLGFGQLDGVAATAGPGLVGGVMVGLSAGKAIAMAQGLPLMAVNHLEGHAVSARLAARAPYPFLLLLVSGGHCQLLAVEGIGRSRRLGTTIDDAAGEAFDKIAASLGLPYPGGPALEALAKGGQAGRFTLPRMLLGRAGCDFSFSGLKTAAARLAETVVSEAERADLAFAVQDAIADQLCERSARAMAGYVREHGAEGRLFVVAGGVAANMAVRARLQATATSHGFAFAAPPLAYCTDNAAMIALAGAERLALGLTDGWDAAARPRWPLDAEAARLQPTHVAGRKGAKA
ncbi:tRNA (adenosine(37)-N6)-threonylcarbamoyltransferase complex transferase subunit TsaD [Caulobacter sp. S45]|uniref:tRNA (adenosine(37)-N6)-threonylcarbamoyltransferase complex transferase subunit TsaD n=1 Tax=Caulobacter sp. S45 TaxID=1641861 RepID=UPI00353025C8